MIKDEFGNRRFYGLYRGEVVDSADPSGGRRLRLRVPQLFHDQITGWAWQSDPGLTIRLPSPGQGVWVQFEGGDPSFPVWTGTFGPKTTSDAIDGGSA